VVIPKKIDTPLGDRVMPELKKLRQNAIPAALAKVERYRLLTQPRLAESICLDILQIDEKNQEANRLLILVITDQFGLNSSGLAKRAREIAAQLESEYDRSYYAGIIAERLGKAALDSQTPGSNHDAYEWFHEAMEYYDRAENLQPEGNDDAILRWNTCARQIENYRLTERPEEKFHPLLE
tara:strand:+ start:2897 stop:3439 length:543 start_codon:yes stop_codon:yes gene_type:complete